MPFNADLVSVPEDLDDEPEPLEVFPQVSRSASSTPEGGLCVFLLGGGTDLLTVMAVALKAATTSLGSTPWHSQQGIGGRRGFGI